MTELSDIPLAVEEHKWDRAHRLMLSLSRPFFETIWHSSATDCLLFTQPPIEPYKASLLSLNKAATIQLRHC